MKNIYSKQLKEVITANHSELEGLLIHLLESNSISQAEAASISKSNTQAYNKLMRAVATTK